MIVPEEHVSFFARRLKKMRTVIKPLQCSAPGTNGASVGGRSLGLSINSNGGQHHPESDDDAIEVLRHNE